MRKEITAFYREKKAINVDFSAEEISSDGALVLLEKLERKHQACSSSFVNWKRYHRIYSPKI